MDATPLIGRAARALFTFGLAALLARPSLAQDGSALTPLQPVTGTLDAGETDTYTYFATSGEVISLLVEGTSSAFDPILQIEDRTGRVLLQNDDFAYPETLNALLEAITLPRTETYTIRVSGYGETSGDYRLTLLPGYASLSATESFENNANGWRSAGAPLAVRAADGALTATIETAYDFGAAFSTGGERYGEFYARMRVTQVSNNAGWSVGMAVRQNGADYYAFMVSRAGTWRFVQRSGEEVRVLRDWINHPAIRQGETAFSLGVLARNDGFDLFYNDSLVGSVSDTALDQPGKIGVVAGAISDLPSETTAAVDDLVITTPLLIDGQPVLPQQIAVGDAQFMAQALTRRHLVSAAGAIALNVPESSVVSARPGVNRIMLGRGARYENFVLGATVEITSTRGGIGGCGLVLRQDGEESYTLAFLDTSGGYGVSRRQGDTFAPGLFGENAAFAGGGQHHLLIIADANTLYFYVDGQFVGSLTDEARSGEVGTAVVNYDPVSTDCGFANLWVYRW